MATADITPPAGQVEWDALLERFSVVICLIEISLRSLQLREIGFPEQQGLRIALDRFNVASTELDMAIMSLAKAPAATGTGSAGRM